MDSVPRLTGKPSSSFEGNHDVRDPSRLNVILDVVNAEQAKIAEVTGVAVLALELSRRGYSDDWANQPENHVIEPSGRKGRCSGGVFLDLGWGVEMAGQEGVDPPADPAECTTHWLVWETVAVRSDWTAWIVLRPTTGIDSGWFR